MKRLIIKFTLLLVATACQADDTSFRALRVAHAGGAIDGKTYTNSYEALNLNLGKGFRYFEIDFSFTSDNRLVCIHDWKDSFKRSFGFHTQEKPTLETFRFLVRNASLYNKCTLDGLADWMRKNPTAVLVTDAKENNLDALRVIMKTIPDAEKRVIPQIYQPINFDSVKDMGFESIIWTLYRFRGTSDHVVNWVGQFQGPVAITIPETMASTNLPSRLKAKNIPTYVHTINTESDMTMYMEKYGLTEIYTDTLQPEPAAQDVN